jgi:hypothetical protein
MHLVYQCPSDLIISMRELRQVHFRGCGLGSVLRRADLPLCSIEPPWLHRSERCCCSGESCCAYTCIWHSSCKVSQAFLVYNFESFVSRSCVSFYDVICLRVGPEFNLTAYLYFILFNLLISISHHNISVFHLFCAVCVRLYISFSPEFCAPVEHSCEG